MKIKDGIVVSKSDLEEWKRRLTENIPKLQCIEDIIVSNNTFATICKIISESQPLEPIIRDAWKCEDNTLDDYINEKKI